VTDVLIQTYNPREHDPSYGFTVIREPSGGSYTIRLGLNCGNMFGCTPEPAHVRQAFFYYVKTGRDLLAQAGNPGGGIR
jgi:hypothetical protein